MVGRNLCPRVNQCSAAPQIDLISSQHRAPRCSLFALCAPPPNFYRRGPYRGVRASFKSGHCRDRVSSWEWPCCGAKQSAGEGWTLAESQPLEIFDCGANFFARPFRASARRLRTHSGDSPLIDQVQEDKNGNARHHEAFRFGTLVGRRWRSIGGEASSWTSLRRDSES